MTHLAGDAANVAGHIIERQMRLSNALHKEPQAAAEPEPNAPYRFLTITRDEGSLGDAVIQELARRSGWKVFDSEIVTLIAESSHVREELVRQLDWKCHSIIEDTILRFLRMPEYKSFGCEEYHAALMRTLASIASQGSAIIVGRGSNIALRDDRSGFHVRISASPKARIASLSHEWGTTPEDARRRMETRDRQRREFVRHHFHRELDDPRFYDLTFNTDRLSVERVSSSILEVINPGRERPASNPGMESNPIH